jgi:hypothetical protein
LFDNYLALQSIKCVKYCQLWMSALWIFCIILYCSSATSCELGLWVNYFCWICTFMPCMSSRKTTGAMSR